MEIVEPAFFAPTSTPSIGPSAWDVTLPVSAAEDEVCAVRKPAKARVDTMATTMVTASKAVFVMRSLHFKWLQAQAFNGPSMPHPACSGNHFSPRRCRQVTTIFFGLWTE